MIDPLSRIRLDENRSQSPVVGTMLMVGVAIVAGAALGITVYSYIADIDDSGPTVTFETVYTAEGGNLTVDLSHRAGDPLDRDKLTVTGSQSGSLSRTSAERYSAGMVIVDDGEVQPGEVLHVRYDTDETESYLVYRERVPESAGQSSTSAPTPTTTTTPTPTATPTPTTTATSTPTTTTTTGGGTIPGFRLPTVAVTIVLATLLARRREQNEEG